MRNRKDRRSMSEEFRISETIDADGHRVIVYEFFGPSRERSRKRKRTGQGASFIKVTFESAASGESAPGIGPGRGLRGDDDLFIARRGLGGRRRRS